MDRALASFGSGLADRRVHYIPVTQMYAEIYNIYAYFSGPSNAMANAANITRSQYQQGSNNKLDGDAELRKIAEAGREWMFSIGRKIDMESESLHLDKLTTVYVYRLCLEWARLNADDRDSMSL